MNQSSYHEKYQCPGKCCKIQEIWILCPGIQAALVGNYADGRLHVNIEIILEYSPMCSSVYSSVCILVGGVGTSVSTG